MFSATGMLTSATVGENVGEMRCSFLEMKLQLSTAAAQSVGLCSFPDLKYRWFWVKRNQVVVLVWFHTAYSSLIFLSLAWGRGEQDRVYLHCVSSTLEIRSEQEADGEV